MKVDEELFASLADQGIDLAEIGLPYGRQQYPDLAAMAPAAAYSQGFLDGIRAFQALMPLLTEGPTYDPAEFTRRLYDPDLLPVTGR